ncbi:MAG: EAL domain-containing protein [Desulfuromonadaceae bacterium]
MDPATLQPRYISPGSVTTHNQQPAEILAEPNWWSNRIHPDDKDRIKTQIENWIAQGCRDQLRHRYRFHKDDHSWTWIEDQLGGVHDENGELKDILGVHTEITRCMKVQDNLYLALQILSQASESIVVMDAFGSIIWVNDAFINTTGYTEQQVMHKTISCLQSDLQGESFYARVWSELKKTGRWQGETLGRRKTGEEFTQALTLAAVHDKDGNLSNYIALFCDITQQKEEEKKLKYHQCFDTLTGLPNRELLKQHLSEAMLNSRQFNHHLALCSIDLDNFKHINESYGPECGDALLCALGRRIEANLHANDTVARVDGDEFMVILNHLERRDDYQGFVQHIQRVVAELFTWNSHKLFLTCSIGITLYPQSNNNDAGHLMRQAGHALYQAKMLGENSRYLFSVDKQEDRLNHNRLINQIRGGLHRGEFVLYYQPKVNMRTEEIIGAEALIRWQHPEHGLQAPGTFLPYIESHPLDIELGLWVIDTAMTQLETWHTLGVHLQVSVNVSGYHLQHPDFVADLQMLLQRHPGVNKGDIEIEVLETSAIEDVHHVSSVIAQCSVIGVDVAIDDFGTGYSSLSYLKHLPAQTLKIDQSFVHDMLTNPDDLSILEGVIGMANAFRRNVIAEGVETVDHGRLLLQLGCEWAQGYGIARPMPADGIPAWMGEWKADSSWKNVAPLGKGEMGLIHASVGHRAWTSQLKEYVEGKTATIPMLDPQRCVLGKWLKAAGNYSDLNSRIGDLHEQVHTLAHNIVDLCQRERREDAREKMAGLDRVNEELAKVLFRGIEG